MAKLIILRGPSGSGKSSVAKKLQDMLGAKTALVEQDYFRRFILREKDTEDGIRTDLISTVAKFILSKGYNVILEGIFYSKRYSGMFQEILEAHPRGNHCYYFDVSLEETLKRHAAKNEPGFGEEKMREWYKDKDLLPELDEILIPESLTLEEAVEAIAKDSSVR
jgi:deoxyadenosine/deoxycytidine kinase